MPTPNQIREQLLKEKGLTSFQPQQHRPRKLKPLPQPTINQSLKTPLMKYLEVKYGEPIEQVLVSGSLSVVAKKLGDEIDVSTVSKWIKKLRLRYDVENLPTCQDCKRHGPACDGGVCYILIDLELYELLPLKKQEMFG